MLSILDIFNNLQGKWEIWRSISHVGEMNGIAVFKKINTKPHALHYREDGILVLTSGESLRMYREYIYICKNHEISVYFLDKDAMENGSQPGQLFHTLKFNAPISETPMMKATAEHLCKNDHYVATYEFYSHHAFQITYKVQGPAKGYISNTLFTTHCALKNMHESAGKSNVESCGKMQNQLQSPSWLDPKLKDKFSISSSVSNPHQTLISSLMRFRS